jgi:glycogen operon protein
MLVAGDEVSRTQQGNNNAYCQDNEISWMDWEKADENLLSFTQKLIKIRREHPAFGRRRWFRGEPVKEGELPDIAWFLPGGEQMNDEHWSHDFAKSLAVFMNGNGLRSRNPKGEPIVDDNFYVIFNAHHEIIDYILPSGDYAKDWTVMLDTGKNYIGEGDTYKAGEKFSVDGRSVILLHSPLKK